MPIHAGIDDKGFYYQYGQTGKKYYVVKSIHPGGDPFMEAYLKALHQTQAIKASESRATSGQTKSPNFKYI